MHRYRICTFFPVLNGVTGIVTYILNFVWYKSSFMEQFFIS